MENSVKFINRLTIGLVLLTGCAADYRMEPAVGDRPEMATMIVASWDDRDQLIQVARLAEGFAKAWTEGNFTGAWNSLSPSWRSAYVAMAGKAGYQAEKLFSEGLIIREGKPEAWNPVQDMFGTNLQYLSSPPPEMQVRPNRAREMVFAVQGDGTCSRFWVVRSDEGQFLEPPFNP